MRIEFEVPKWAYGKHIHVFAGIELLGIKECRVVHINKKHVITYLPLKIKPEDGRCNGCGNCCSFSGISKQLIDKIKLKLKNYNYEDQCPFLESEGCMLGAWIPFSCAKSICTAYEGCTERLEVVE